MVLLLKYFKLLKYPRTPLLDTDGSLSKVVNRGTIKVVDMVTADNTIYNELAVFHIRDANT